MNKLRRCLALLCVLWTLPTAALGSFQVTDETPAPTAPPVTPVPAERPEPFLGLPQLTEAGFLKEPLSASAPAFIHVDEQAGHWYFISEDLHVHIERRRLKVRYKWVYYFIAHVRFQGEQLFRAYNKNPDKPEKGRDKPEHIAAQHNLVYAQNGDLYTWRIEEKKYPGVIIRDGRIIRNQSYNRATINIPPLDELSLYPDGHVEMRSPGAVTAEEYLEKGALDVLAFGPMLLTNGQIDDRLDINFKHTEPRSALGVVGPGHFVGIMVEGRNKRSAGASLRFVAERLLEEGVTDAYTLDGGQTAAMVFMGRIVMDPGTYNGYTKTRRQPDVVGIGTTTQTVPGGTK